MMMLMMMMSHAGEPLQVAEERSHTLWTTTDCSNRNYCDCYRNLNYLLYRSSDTTGTAAMTYRIEWPPPLRPPLRGLAGVSRVLTLSRNDDPHPLITSLTICVTSVSGRFARQADQGGTVADERGVRRPWRHRLRRRGL